MYGCETGDIISQYMDMTQDYTTKGNKVFTCTLYLLKHQSNMLTTILWIHIKPNIWADGTILTAHNLLTLFVAL